MSLQLLIDMNLSPDWVPWFEESGWPAVHWSNVGNPRADDAVIMQWAREHGFAVFTHDLDFGATLALTHAAGPSVIQVRGTGVLPEQIGTMVAQALNRYQSELECGALVVIDPKRNRVRILPL